MVLACYEAWGTGGDLAAFESLLANDETVLLVGTDPNEWWSGRNAIIEALRALLPEETDTTFVPGIPRRSSMETWPGERGPRRMEARGRDRGALPNDRRRHTGGRRMEDATNALVDRHRQRGRDRSRASGLYVGNAGDLDDYANDASTAVFEEALQDPVGSVPQRRPPGHDPDAIVRRGAAGALRGSSSSAPTARGTSPTNAPQSDGAADSAHGRCPRRRGPPQRPRRRIRLGGPAPAEVPTTGTASIPTGRLPPHPVPADDEKPKSGSLRGQEGHLDQER